MRVLETAILIQSKFLLKRAMHDKIFQQTDEKEAKRGENKHTFVLPSRSFKLGKK